MSYRDGTGGRNATGNPAQPDVEEQPGMSMTSRRPIHLPWTGTVLALVMMPIGLAAADEPKKDKDKAQPNAASSTIKVSYDKQIRPIFQARCQGCHQPAKAGGNFVMTTFERMVKGGESGEAAIVAGKPAESHLITLITPEAGKAEMPQNKPPLSSAEIELIVRWIAQGASDDTPRAAKTRYDQDHPPVYTRLPVIPALAFSVDGSLLAVAGFHEVLLWKSDGSELVGRLVGLSERIESLAFSPDGKRLAVCGGRPADGRGAGLGRGRAQADALGPGQL